MGSSKERRGGDGKLRLVFQFFRVLCKFFIEIRLLFTYPLVSVYSKDHSLVVNLNEIFDEISTRNGATRGNYTKYT